MKNNKLHCFIGYLCLALLLCLTGAQPQALAELTVPVHVERGTNLIHLARDYCHTRQDWKTIAEINGLTPPYLIIEQTEVDIPLSLLKVTHLQARIATVHGKVTRTSSQPVSRAVEKGTFLSSGDTLVTGQDAYAHVIFPDHRYLRLEPRSRLTIDYMIKLTDGSIKIDYTLSTGRVINTILERLQPNDSHIIRTPVAITGVRGTQYRMKTEDAQTSTIETLSGRVNVAAAGESITLQKNQGTSVTKGAPPAPPKALLPPPEDLPVKDYYRVLPVIIPAPSHEQAKQLRLRITKDDQGTDTIKELYADPGASFVLDAMEDGSYYSFLTALDEEGFEGAPSGPHRFQVRTIPSAPVISIPENEAVSWESQVKIQWLKGDQAEQFHYQLATDSAFSSVLAEDTLSQPGLTTKELVPGQYFFRVQALAADGFRSQYSPVISFTVVKQPELSPITTSAEEAIPLQWAAMGEHCTYELQVADDHDFKRILINATGLEQSSYTVEKDLIPGEYFIRIRGIINQGDEPRIGPWTSPQTLMIERGPLSWEEVMIGLVFLTIIIL